MNKWSNQIEEITAKFQASFDSVSEEDLNWKPSPEVWSIAENIDHLIMVNRTYYPGFSALKKGNYQLPFIARFDFVVSFFGNLILKSVQPDRKKKMKTFTIWKPAESKYSKDILSRFVEEQSILTKEIEQVMDKTNENAVISSPVNKNIVYRLETAFDIIVAHERRHFQQAMEIHQLILDKKNIPGNNGD